MFNMYIALLTCLFAILRASTLTRRHPCLRLLVYLIYCKLQFHFTIDRILAVIIFKAVWCLSIGSDWPLSRTDIVPFAVSFS